MQAMQQSAEISDQNIPEPGFSETDIPEIDIPEIDIMVCTIDAGIERVPGVLMPQRQGVGYVVAMQYTDKRYIEAVPDELRLRTDVTLIINPGRGLCRNRNCALEAARRELLLVADDDTRLRPEGVDELRQAYAKRPGLDIALVRMADYEGRIFKTYPSGEASLDEAMEGGYYAASVEMSMRRRVAEAGLRFDERFGLGAPHLCCGEEAVFLKDAQDNGFRIALLPIDVARTQSATTGRRLASDAKVQMSKGAALCYCEGLARAVWLCLRAAARAMIVDKANPLPIMARMAWGMWYVKHTRKNNGPAHNKTARNGFS